eukprot:gene12535-biopygen18492
MTGTDQPRRRWRKHEDAWRKITGKHGENLKGWWRKILALTPRCTARCGRASWLGTARGRWRRRWNAAGSCSRPVRRGRPSAPKRPGARRSGCRPAGSGTRQRGARAGSRRRPPLQ